MSDTAPEFVKFVSAVDGRLATRWGGLNSYFGASLATPDQVAQGAQPITWDTEKIYGLTAEYVSRFSRELEHALRDGDLVARTKDEFEAQDKVAKEARAKRRKDREAEAEALRKAAEKEAAAAEKAAKKAEAERLKRESEGEHTGPNPDDKSGNEESNQ